MNDFLTEVKAMKTTVIQKQYDVIVVGGGIGGICAAVSAARHGAKTALIQDRPVLGGNASSEIKMHIVGANCHAVRPDARETGILEEIMLENKHRNPNHSFSVFDTVMWEKVRYQKGLDLYLNTHMFDVKTENGHIISVTAKQMTTEKMLEFFGGVFIDCTGDGLLSYLAGAEYMSGREGKKVFGEEHAVDRSDCVTMGNSILFSARDIGEPVKFEAPFWANHYTDADLMGHDKEITSGYWWIEIGGTHTDVIKDGEELRDELLKIIYGVWDHIKNGGDHGAENYALEWIGFLPGKRESRRITGDYVLKEQDLIEGRIFEDAIAYGGWHIDSHQQEKFLSIGTPQTEDLSIKLENIYSIPYRCVYARSVDNLMMGGRLISASHRAFASTRVMGTCAVVSQAAGTAAAMATSAHCAPSEVEVGELQQILLKDDCFIPYVKNQDEKDWARKAKITASSSEAKGNCQNAVNGLTRTIGTETNCWISKEMSMQGEWIMLEFPQIISPKEVRLTFDSDLSCEIMPTLSKWIQDRQPKTISDKLLSDYRIRYLMDGKEVAVKEIKGNYQRHCIHTVTDVKCNQIKIEALPSNKDKHCRIFEIRVY